MTGYNDAMKRQIDPRRIEVVDHAVADILRKMQPHERIALAADAFETARQMVCRFGMSDKLGAQTFGSPGQRFLDSPAMFGEQRNFSEDTARVIDQEVKSIVDVELARAKAILSERRHLLSEIAERLLVEETLERSALEKILESAPPLSLGQDQAAAEE